MCPLIETKLHVPKLLPSRKCKKKKPHAQKKLLVSIK